tara:strand:- start:357 stop:713 length:357 start_codon:yes stop_codon:yes gene_type:complete
MGDRTVGWVIQAFLEGQGAMTLPEIISKVKEKKRKEINERYDSDDTFNAAVRNILTVYMPFKKKEKKKGKAFLWSYDKDEVLVRKKYGGKRVRKSPPTLPSPPRFPQELFVWYEQNFV